MANHKFGTGLKPTPKDDRDFGLIDVYKQLRLEDIPSGDWSFYDPLEVKNQRGTQQCAGHAVAAALEGHEKVIINPSVQYAFIKELAGDPTDTGADLRTAMKSGLKVGGVEKRDCDFGVDNHDGDFLAEIKNYPEPDKLKAKAELHRQRSFFSGDKGRYDRFDNFKTWLFGFRYEDPVIVTGVKWRENWTDAAGGIIPEDEAWQIGGHAIAGLPKFRIIDGKEYLGFLNSYGAEVGDNGIFWFPREVINRDFSYDAFIYRDRGPEEIKQLKEKGTNMAEEAKPAIQSQTILGVLKLVIPIAVAILGYFGVEVTAEESNSFLDAVEKILLAVLSLWGLWDVVMGRYRATKPIRGIFRAK